LTTKKTQRAELLGLLLQANGRWVGLPEILDLKIAQYNSRIHELRKQKFQIESRTEVIDGARHSWFRLKKGAGPSQADLPLHNSPKYRDPEEGAWT
jgi:hypothetical protein